MAKLDSEFRLTPIDDSYIRSSARKFQTNADHGDLDVLTIKNDGLGLKNIGFNYKAYVRFDLENRYSNIRNASLSLTIESPFGGSPEASELAPNTLLIYGIKDSRNEIWQENRINWYNAPANEKRGPGFKSSRVTDKPIARIDFEENPEPGQKFVLEDSRIVRFLNENKNNSVTLLFALKDEKSGSSGVNLASKEHRRLAPVTLEIEAGKIQGTAKADEMRGSQGDDTLQGRRGNDRISGGDGDDRLNGGNGNDRIDGGDGDDRLFGDNQNDTLIGGRGSDLLLGGPGDDLLTGGSDADVFRFDRLNEGVDRIRDLNRNQDVIKVNRLAIKGGFGKGILDTDGLERVKRIRDLDDNFTKGFVYATGEKGLFYLDEDRNIKLTQLAILSNRPNLGAANIEII